MFIDVLFLSVFICLILETQKGSYKISSVMIGNILCVFGRSDKFA